MNKEEWISVGVKLFGVYLLVMAIIATPQSLADIIQSYYISSTCNLDADIVHGTNEAMQIAEFACGTIPSKLIKAVFSIFMYAGFGIYFIKSGKLIKSLLSE